MPTLTLPEIEAEPPPQEEGLLERIRPSPRVAVGAHVDAVMQLYRTRFEGVPQASVIVHPSSVIVTVKVLEELDPNFTQTRLGTMQIWRGHSPQEVYDSLLGRISPLISFMDHRYPLNNAQIDEHSFPYSEFGRIRLAFDHLTIGGEKSSQMSLDY